MFGDHFPNESRPYMQPYPLEHDVGSISNNFRKTFWWNNN